MRTTADLDEDVMAAARALAQHEHITLARAVDELPRRGLPSAGQLPVREGFPTFMPVEGHVITDALVAEHR